MGLQWIHYRNLIAHGDGHLAPAQSPGSGLLVMCASVKSWRQGGARHDGSTETQPAKPITSFPWPTGKPLQRVECFI